ncbi:MAG: RNA methyltransferase [Thermoguttaceae bacterium]|nr:RNA methyltransferase [Thermoguttaceae bacterium]MDW8078858.1 RNA methyltransferase [Thermoguttaceae bacterium]
MWRRIASPHNPRVKAVQKLLERSGRSQAHATVAQGVTEIARAGDGQFQGDQLFFCPEWCSRELAEECARRLRVPPSGVFEVTPEVYERLAFGDRRDGILAVIQTRQLPLAELEPRGDQLFLVVEGIEKPGNLGAIFRSADAAGADGIIIASGRCDPWGPNVIRASLGTIFTVPFYLVDTAEAVQWVRRAAIRVVAAEPEATALFWDVDLSPPVAIVLGAEHEGLTEVWRTVATTSARIPMLGRADSLNVSVAAALFLYEAVRQKLASGKCR